MQTGDTREFEIDKDNKKNCRLPVVDNAIKIKIRKQKESGNTIDDQYWFTTLEEVKAYVVCAAGYVAMLEVKGNAQDCGIGKILMRLCLNEEEIHNVADNVRNKAVSRMASYSRINVPKARELENWLKSKCKKMLYLTMTAPDKPKAHVYFNSAFESGYTEMFIAFGFNKGFYPPEGPCPVRTLKGRYTDDGYMEDNEESVEVRMVKDDRVKVWGTFWFFCKPKIPTKQEKCTDL